MVVSAQRAHAADLGLCLGFWWFFGQPSLFCTCATALSLVWAFVLGGESEGGSKDRSGNFRSVLYGRGHTQSSFSLETGDFLFIFFPNSHHFVFFRYSSDALLHFERETPLVTQQLE